MLGLDAACVRYFVVHLHSFHAWEACAARGAEETAQLKSECMAQRHKRQTFQSRGDCCAVILEVDSPKAFCQGYKNAVKRRLLLPLSRPLEGEVAGTRASELCIDYFVLL